MKQISGVLFGREVNENLEILHILISPLGSIEDNVFEEEEDLDELIRYYE